MRPRDEFFAALLYYAMEDPRIHPLYGDVGGAFLDEWNTHLPGRALNMMPAEQNMILVAAGMAKEGLRPFVYSIAPFLIFRPYEMIRIYLGHQRLPVKLVGVGRDNTYAEAGFTHWTGFAGRAEDARVAALDARVLVWGEDDYEGFIESDKPGYLELRR